MSSKHKKSKKYRSLSSESNSNKDSTEKDEELREDEPKKKTKHRKDGSFFNGTLKPKKLKSTFARLTMSNFRCYVYSKIKLQLGAQTLITGESGDGKSTIIDAIKWALFGCVQKVAGFKYKTKKVQVLFELPEIQIMRETVSAGLKVWYKGEIWDEKNQAQAVIDNYFGSEDIWECSSWLDVEKMNLFLSGKSIDKSNLIYKLAFGSTTEDPDIVIEKLEEIEKTLKTKFETHSEKLRLHKRSLEEFKKDKSYKTSTKETIESIKFQLIKLKLELKKLKEIDETHKSKTIELKLIKDQYLKLEEKEKSLKKLKLLTIDEEKTLETSIERLKDASIDSSKHQSQFKIWKLWNISTEKLKSAKSLNNELPESEDELVELKVKIKVLLEKFKESKIAFKEAGIEYSQNVLNEQLTNLSFEVERQPLLEEAQKLRTLIKSVLKKDNIEIETVIESLKNSKLELDELKAKLEIVELEELETKQFIISLKLKIKQSLELLQCPSCKETLKFNDSKLVLASGYKDLELLPGVLKEKEIKLKEQKDNINVLNDKIETISKEIVSLSKLIKEWKLSLDLFPQLIGNQFWTFSLPMIEVKKRYKLLCKLKLESEPKFTIDIIVLQLETIKLIKEEKETKNKVLENNGNLEEPKIDNVSIKEVEEKIKLIKLQINESKSIALQLSTVNKSLIETEIKIKQIIEVIVLPVVDEILKLETTILSLSTTQLTCERGLQVEEKEKSLILLKEEHEKKHDTLTMHRRVKEIAISSKNDTLESYIEKINSTLGSILDMFFEDSIQATLSMNKKLKNKKTVQKVNLAIVYKGDEYDSITQMSRGERIRISLAMMVTINRIAGSRFLLIDEVIANISDQLKEKCISAIRELITEDTLAINILHGANEGDYESVINVLSI